MNDSAAKKDIQKLQRAIVDALEDVKAHDIHVYDTEHLSPLFERVIIAAGTSNRQTKALSASVRDKVREAGFGKPRIEGEDNGEWIIVDCGQAVVHIMQPTIRAYYNLEEIWGDKPVRLKFGAPKPVASTALKDHVRKPAAKKAGSKTTASKTTAVKPAVKSKVALKVPAKTSKAAATKVAKSPATKTPAAKTPAVKRAASKAPGTNASKPTVKTVGKPTAKAVAKKASPTARKSVKPASRKSA